MSLGLSQRKIEKKHQIFVPATGVNRALPGTCRPHHLGYLTRTPTGFIFPHLWAPRPRYTNPGLGLVGSGQSQSVTHVKTLFRDFPPVSAFAGNSEPYCLPWLVPLMTSQFFLPQQQRSRCLCCPDSELTMLQLSAFLAGFFAQFALLAQTWLSSLFWLWLLALGFVGSSGSNLAQFCSVGSWLSALYFWLFSSQNQSMQIFCASGGV